MFSKANVCLSCALWNIVLSVRKFFQFTLNKCKFLKSLLGKLFICLCMLATSARANRKSYQRILLSGECEWGVIERFLKVFFSHIERMKISKNTFEGVYFWLTKWPPNSVLYRYFSRIKREHFCFQFELLEPKYF